MGWINVVSCWWRPTSTLAMGACEVCWFYTLMMFLLQGAPQTKFSKTPSRASDNTSTLANGMFWHQHIPWSTVVAQFSRISTALKFPMPSTWSAFAPSHWRKVERMINQSPSTRRAKLVGWSVHSNGQQLNAYRCWRLQCQFKLVNWLVQRSRSWMSSTKHFVWKSPCRCQFEVFGNELFPEFCLGWFDFGLLRRRGLLRAKWQMVTRWLCADGMWCFSSRRQESARFDGWLAVIQIAQSLQFLIGSRMSSMFYSLGRTDDGKIVLTAFEESMQQFAWSPRPTSCRRMRKGDRLQRIVWCCETRDGAAGNRQACGHRGSSHQRRVVWFELPVEMCKQWKATCWRPYKGGWKSSFCWMFWRSSHPVGSWWELSSKQEEDGRSRKNSSGNTWIYIQHCKSADRDGTGWAASVVRASWSDHAWSCRACALWWRVWHEVHPHRGICIVLGAPDLHVVCMP